MSSFAFGNSAMMARGCLNAALSRHAHIEHRDIRTRLPILIQGLRSIRRLGDDLHARLAADQGTQAHANNIMVISDEDAK